MAEKQRENPQKTEKTLHRKKRAENIRPKILLIVFSVMFIFSLGIYLNEKFFRLEFIPTSAEITAALGGKKPVTASGGEMAVHFIDVGQGDCALIVAGNTRVLIDSGLRDYSSRVIRYISALGFRRIDYVIATHPHDDHIGGMADILNEFSIGRIIMPEVPESMVTTATYLEDMLNVIEQKDIRADYSRTGEVITLGNGAELTILSPVHSDYSSLNNFSITCRLSYGSQSFLFTGDIERAAESDIINSGAYIRSTVLKVPHHGSSTSSTPAFLEAVHPEYAVISIEKDNQYGHPHQEVVNRINELNCEMLDTSVSGSIVFLTDGESLEIREEKQLPNAA